MYFKYVDDIDEDFLDYDDILIVDLKFILEVNLILVNKFLKRLYVIIDVGKKLFYF